ncbi:M949_RS01915 family surface polysaccharide biosynthesis protein [Flavobacterium notoginsengisoli]|uniref:M949_RS01915 family surface polysaccharide biosynthesis protein n=1 Tax=Flavobacterium notoginsengisoli TaxID=1478199 RepID=UPI0036419662
MKNIPFLFLFILFSNCKSDKKEEETVALKEKVIKEIPFVLNVKKIDSTQFPESIKYEGFIKNAVRWKDKLGDNIVVTTETGYHINPKFEHESDGSDAELFAYHFIVSGNKAKQTWKVYDYIADCPVDIVASFVKDTFQVTDLNHNGIAEIWLMYKTICHGDVSPCDMKIIMYEETQKYAMRGENKVQVGVYDNGEKQFIGGKFKFDENFTNGPKVFKEFARKLWNENLMENWEN